ncbi:MAG TPA: hypothetical protein VGJ33_04450 [Candidatus Angelobacter sp.]|jgi:hypothetical protein
MARKKPSKKKTAGKKKAVGKKTTAKKKLATKKTTAGKKLPAKKKAGAKKPAARPMSKSKSAPKRQPARKAAHAKASAKGRRQASNPISISSRRGLGADSGGQSGDTQGLSRRENVDSESVEELMEEGQYEEAEAVSGVENARDADQGEVKTRQFPEDDVPQEYLDEE